jgi:hypothetical protein
LLYQGYGYFLCRNHAHTWKWEKTPFWHAPWLDGRKPKDITPLIFEVSKRKNWPVFQALDDNAWIQKVCLEQLLLINHITQFVEL